MFCIDYHSLDHRQLPRISVLRNSDTSGCSIYLERSACDSRYCYFRRNACVLSDVLARIFFIVISSAFWRLRGLDYLSGGIIDVHCLLKFWRCRQVVIRGAGTSLHVLALLSIVVQATWFAFHLIEVFVNFSQDTFVIKYARVCKWITRAKEVVARLFIHLHGRGIYRSVSS